MGSPSSSSGTTRKRYGPSTMFVITVVVSKPALGCTVMRCVG